jgi:hypothetical protein
MALGTANAKQRQAAKEVRQQCHLSTLVQYALIYDFQSNA